MYHSNLWTRSTLVAGAAAAIALFTTGVASAQSSSDPVKCRQAVSAAGQKYEDARAKTVQKCEEAVAKGKLPATTDCTATTAPPNDQKTLDKVNKAKTKLDSTIAKACCGKDKICGAGAADEADLALSAYGWAARGLRCTGGSRDGLVCLVLADCPSGTCDPADVCPNLENGDCDDAVTHPGTVGDCLECLGDATTNQIVGLSYDDLKPLQTADKAIEKCKLAIGKNSAKYFSAKRKALAGCEKGAIKDALPAGTCPDTKANEKITKARGKMLDGIAKACGGDDKAFGGGDDLALDAIGAPLSCEGVDEPGALPNCYSGVMATVQDYANCLACVNDFKATCGDFQGAPSNGSYPAECNSLCGNSKIDAGESCDDGNVADGDACPADCVRGTCNLPIGGPVTATVNFTPAPSETLASFTVYIEYDETKMRIPGNPLARINVPSGAFVTANDLDYGIRVVLTSPDGSAVPSPLFEIDFDTCAGAALADSDFTCRVEQVATSGTTPVLTWATCSVDVP